MDRGARNRAAVGATGDLRLTIGTRRGEQDGPVRSPELERAGRRDHISWNGMRFAFSSGSNPAAPFRSPLNTSAPRALLCPKRRRDRQDGGGCCYRREARCIGAIGDEQARHHDGSGLHPGLVEGNARAVSWLEVPLQKADPLGITDFSPSHSSQNRASEMLDPFVPGASPEVSDPSPHRARSRTRRLTGSRCAPHLSGSQDASTM